MRLGELEDEMKPKMHVPALVLCRPKYPHNVAGAIRAASCFDVKSLIYTGERFTFESGERIPREERMKGYADVSFCASERPFDLLERGTPVCVELHNTSRSLVDFEHPEDAIYIFGPEDGHVSQMLRRFCHHFVHIPTKHCLNLSAAINVVLYDRRAKRLESGLELPIAIADMLDADRGALPSVVGWDGK
jgi:tRNA(Leu) C34 or U34 (ribose-2'-O)-methylase TrmL